MRTPITESDRKVMRSLPLKAMREGKRLIRESKQGWGMSRGRELVQWAIYHRALYAADFRNGTIDRG